MSADRVLSPEGQRAADSTHPALMKCTPQNANSMHESAATDFNSYFNSWLRFEFEITITDIIWSILGSQLVETTGDFEPNIDFMGKRNMVLFATLQNPDSVDQRLSFCHIMHYSNTMQFLILKLYCTYLGAFLANSSQII